MSTLLAKLDQPGDGSHESDAWRMCARLATAQDGMVGRPQLRRAGVPAGHITRWVRRGLLYRRHRGVYSVGHEALTPRGLLRAALLACGDGAILSHGAAAYLWDLVDTAPEPVDVTVVGRHRSRAGLRVHQVREIRRRDVRRRHGFPVTSPARTILDQAVYVPLDELDDLIGAARANRLLRPGELEELIQRAGRRPGVARTRASLAAEGEPALTRSSMERTLRRLIREARLAQPLTNAKVAGYEVDFLWRDAKLIVEVDGWRFHGHRRAFENDRRKDIVLTNAGYQVLRFTWRQLTEEPLTVIAAIAGALARRQPMAA